MRGREPDRRPLPRGQMPGDRVPGDRTAPGPVTAHSEQARRLDRMEALAYRMDRAFRIPFTQRRFGWDSIIGLVPGVGDTLALAPAAYILREAHALGASKPVLARMVGNVGLDWLVGLVPLAGDVFDVAVKSNSRNVALLRDHLSSLRP